MNVYTGNIRTDSNGLRGVRIVLWTVLVATVMAVAPRVEAAPLCIPPGFGVPALSGPPNWYDTAPGEPRYWPRLDDPRWRGALGKSKGTGTAEHVQFRALRDSSALYLSWWVRVDPQLSPLADRLFVAFSPGGAAPDELIEIAPFSSASSSISAGTPSVASVRRRSTVDNLFGPQIMPPPTWVGSATGKTKIWLDIVENSWAINMVVPVTNVPDNGINLQATFKMWFELQVTTPSGMVAYRLIDTLTRSDVENGTDATTWAEMSRTLDPSNPTCTKAVSIASDGVGTKNVDGGGIARPNRIALSGTNTFFARPKNESIAPNVPANAICAQFRIANWGTQPDWNDIPNPTTSLWKLITPDCALPGGLTNPGPILNGQTASEAAGNEITFNWTLTHNERCEFLGTSGIPAQGGNPAIPGEPGCPNADPIRRQHQCMLVELSGGGLVYTPSSVYRNMDFVDASTFEREAEVSVAGLTQLPGPRRDVFLYVKTFNMPAFGDQTRPGHVLRDLEKLQKFEDRCRDGEGSGSGCGDGGDANRRTTRGNVPSPNQSFDVLDQTMPTYVIHVYHDTGKVVTEGGVTRKVLEPQSSFGYYVRHDGALVGWDTALAGAQRIAPNFYRIGVPEGGSAVVKTKVTALEHAPPPCNGGCCCARSSNTSSTTPAKVTTLGVFVLVGIVIGRRRRRAR
jgi:hypothetical protein